MAEEVEAGLGAEDYPGEEVPEIAGPRNHLVVQGDGSADFNYKVGVLELDLFQGESTEVVAICVVDSKLLVAVPDNIWNRSVQKRKLPQRGLIKPSLVSVTGCVESLRETEEEVAGQLKVWVGLLMPELEGAVEYGTDVEPTFGFGVTSQGLPLVPHADALVEIANELFSFFTAESAPANVGGDDHGARLQQLEAMMEEIRGTLATVAGDRKKEEVRRVANPKPTPGPGKPRRQAGKDGADPAVRGLDAGTVRSAMQAGVPLEHLREVGSILKEKPKKLEELPRQNARRRKGPLSESEEDEEGAGEDIEVAADGDEGGTAKGAPLEQAILQLTQIAKRLSGKKGQKDQLENLLDGGSGSAGSTDNSGTGGNRKNSAALRAWTRCLQENPAYIYETIEAQLQSDFLSRPIQPGEPMTPSTTVRGWLAARSRILNYQNHVRWVWQVGGIWDALIQNRPQEARARCALLVSAADQASIDQGSWVISNVSLLEAPPPYQQFAHHQQPSPQEQQYSTLYDSRWADIFLGHLKEVDSYVDAKKKLSGKTNPPPNPKGDKEEAARAKAKARAERAAKARASRDNTGPEGAET